MDIEKIKAKGKRKTQDPCTGCWMHKTRCFCADIPLLTLKTKVCLVVHSKELKRTTNTGRLAVRALTNSEMRIRGSERVPLDLSDLLDAQYQPLLFYPTDDGAELTKELIASFDRPVLLIVPDGNWRQASKINSRHPELSTVPRVKISTELHSQYHLRAENTPAGMATLQAIGYALQIIEGPEAGDPLLALYDRKLQQTLVGRGTIPEPQL
jgi:DTW domain-containing protein YfiP